MPRHPNACAASFSFSGRHGRVSGTAVPYRPTIRTPPYILEYVASNSSSHRHCCRCSPSPLNPNPLNRTALHCTVLHNTRLPTVHRKIPTTIIMSAEKEYTLDEISQHTTTESCWLIIGNASNG